MKTEKKRLSQEDMGKLSKEGQELVRELYEALDSSTAEAEKLEKALEKKRAELGLTKAGECPPAVTEWQCVSREWWRLPVCLLTMPDFSLSDIVLCAYLIDVTKRGEREVLLSCPHASARTGISMRQVKASMKKLTAHSLIETTQTGREVKVKLTGAVYLMSDRGYRSEPAEGGVI